MATLSDRINEVVTDKGFKISSMIVVEDVKKFIREFEEYMNQKFLKEKNTHKNHRVQALLLDIRAELTELAGDKLCDAVHAVSEPGVKE